MKVLVKKTFHFANESEISIVCSLHQHGYKLSQSYLLIIYWHKCYTRSLGEMEEEVVTCSSGGEDLEDSMEVEDSEDDDVWKYELYTIFYNPLRHEISPVCLMLVY